MFATFYRQLKLFLNQYIGSIIITVILITACQSGVPNSRNLETGRTPSTDCRVVKHAGGETTICGKPQKVVALEPKPLSMMLEPLMYSLLLMQNLICCDRANLTTPANRFLTWVISSQLNRLI